MISYYELLGMIKEDKAPRKIRVHLTKKPKIYKAVYDFGDFNYYTLYEEDIIDDDYKDYLAECFLESSMFEKNIEILDKKKIPEKLPYYSMKKIQKAKNKDEWREERITLIEKRVDDLHIKMNDLLDYLKSKGDE